MTHKKIFTVPFRRKREGRTDYKMRLAFLKSKTPRMVVRRSNKHTLAQLIQYADEGDKVIASATTKELEKFGWNKNSGNITASYLCGLLLGVRAKGKKAILDIGLQTKSPRLFAALKGAADGGLKIEFTDKIVPSEDRLTGKHIKSEDVFKKTKEKILSGAK
jgi:large subunit ribosomal protein L18